MGSPTHPNVVHWDDVEAERIDVGELRCTVRGLGAAAGAFRAGVNRVRVDPGGRSSPAHCHADEEELFYVLGGDGLVWLDGVTHRIGAGDVLCHRVHEEAHTLVAGPDGLDVLAFGPQSEQNITWLPHAQVMRVGPRWMPSEVENPFLAERDAGPLPLPEAPAPDRPATVAHLDEVPVDHWDRPGYEKALRDIGVHLGSETTGLRHAVLGPGALSAPPHWHTMEEELFVVLAGDGELRLGDAWLPVRAGSVVARPPQAREAHAFRAGPGGLTLLAWGTRVPGDLVYYPRSQTVNVRGLVFRAEPVDLWDGEG